MVDGTFFGYNFGGVVSGLSAFSSFMVNLFLVIICVAMIWMLFYLLSFKIQVVVRQQTASGYVVVNTKARQFKTRDGVTKWRLLKYIREVHTPPATTFMELTKKGKFHAEADRTLEGVMTWRKRSILPDGLDTFSGEERLVTMIEIRRAEEYKKKKGLDKLLAMAPLLIIVIMLVIIFAFWGSFVDSTSKAAASIGPASDRLAQASDRLANAVLVAYGEDITVGEGGNQTYFGTVPPPN